MLEFFTAQINNDHTRAAYMNAARRFARWCETKGLLELADVQPFHVAAFVKELQRQIASPTVKQHLAALRMLFDWLVTGHVLDTNPAHAVRGPRYVVRKGKTSVLAADEARALLDSTPVARNVLLEDGTEIAQPLLVGLRDRALIGVMVFTFARVNAVTQLKVKDYYTQGRRGWIRLHEKGGKEHDVPCNHALETLLDAYIQAAGIKDDPEGPRCFAPCPAARRGNSLATRYGSRTPTAWYSGGQKRPASRSASAITRSARPASPTS